ncbi:MAG: hypothetical protein AAF721_41495 [Myxococcota bacterium]
MLGNLWHLRAVAGPRTREAGRARRSSLAPWAAALGIAVSCRPTAPSESPGSATPAATPSPTSESEAAPVAEPKAKPDLGALVADLTLVRPAGRLVELAGETEECEGEGFPETLSAAGAQALGDAAPGGTVTIVHPAGQTVATITEAGCLAYEEYAQQEALLLTLDVPAGPQPSGSEVARAFAPPYLGFVFTVPHIDARLTVPPVFSRDAEFAPRVARIVAAFAEREAARRREDCREAIADGDIAPPTDIAAAVARTQVWQLAAAEPTVWVLLDDPAVTFTCYAPDETEGIGMLVDVEAGAVVLTVESNNGIELPWVVDLDGDGTQEALLDVQWLEDGGHEIALLRKGPDGWGRESLWVADTP